MTIQKKLKVPDFNLNKLHQLSTIYYYKRGNAVREKK